MITVFHLSMVRANRDARDDMYYERDPAVKQEMFQKLWQEGFYEKVAVVNTDNLNDAIVLTNHIDVAWTDRSDPRLTVFQEEARSTSVTDVMLKDGIYYYVDRGCGFTVMDIPQDMEMARG